MDDVNTRIIVLCGRWFFEVLGSMQSHLDRLLLQALLQGSTIEEISNATGLPPGEVEERVRVLSAGIAGSPDGNSNGSRPPFVHRRLARLLELWRSRRRGRPFPAHGELRITDLQPWIHNIGIVEVERRGEQEPAVKVRIAGRNVIDIDGADFAGSYLNDRIPDHARADILDPYAGSLANMAPQYSLLRPAGAPSPDCRLHRLLLPCAGDGRNVDLMLVGIYVDAWPDSRMTSQAESIYDWMAPTGT